jgi:coenzyme PQQ synthesis protein D (PqqD)
VSLSINDAVIWNETAEGVSLYHTETGDFLTLNETGAKIWLLVDSDGERDKIISRLSLQFAGRNELMSGRIRADVSQFLDSMISAGLLAENEAA